MGPLQIDFGELTIWEDSRPYKEEPAMTAGVQQLLRSFDALSEAEKQEAAAEVLRRTLPAGSDDLPEESLTMAAEALFLELDAREAADAQR
jgi:hypothetical protein